MARTPIMQQYYDMKSKNPNILLFFRLGDFYEMFGDDAKETSALLGLTLTARNGEPMSGVPYHSANSYISKLLKMGKKIAICEQTSTTPDPKTKLFERKIVRIITPGTVLEDVMLDAKNSNYLTAIETNQNGWGLACLEASTGEFWITENNNDADLTALAGLLGSINPAEIIASKETLSKLKTKIILPASVALSTFATHSNLDMPQTWPGALCAKPLALKAGLMSLSYITANNNNFQEYFTPYYKEISEFLQLDNSAVNTLELVSSQGGARKNTLWGILDYAKTPMASRLLKEWILRPLLDIAEISARQDAIEALLKNEAARDSLGLILKEVSDIARIMSRVATSSATPRDLAGLRSSLLLVDKFESWLNTYGEILPRFKTIIEGNLPKLKEISKLLFDAIDENPPTKLSDGGIIRPGYNSELDELTNLKQNADVALQNIAVREREKTGIPTLKVGFNNVFGYYIEVSKIQAGKVPYDYTRKQTLANAERFITEELKELEKKILSAEERSLRLELGIFEEIKKYLYINIDLLKAVAEEIAKADCLSSLAIAALNGNYTRPQTLKSNETLFIEKGRHPIVEENIPSGSFVPNNLLLGGGEGPQIMLITGPNMGGKSVYLKQTALITIMAQMGSFVPAAHAKIPLTDKILTRIGAQDALSLGQSTFMVEMREAAAILASATNATLVLLDEIGRGTSTFDGISIAWAIVEFLYKPHGNGPKVLFATHYFELTELAEKYKGIKNYHVDAAEYQGDDGEVKLNFLFEIKQGAADKSYGIHVADLAGLPQSCILRARKILKDLGERENTGIVKKESLGPDLFSSPILEEIKMADLNKITPLEALQLIAQWQKRAK